MAETEPGVGGERRTGLILMIVAFVAMGGFLYWLSVNAKPTSVAIDEGADTAAEDASIPTVSVGTFTQDPMQYEGERIRLRDISVASTLGSQAFWFELSNSNPYLVKIDTALVAMGTQVSSGDLVQRVEGRVYAMSDSVLDAWEAQGAFTEETNRLEAEYATSFIQATVVEIRPASPTEEGGGSGS